MRGEDEGEEEEGEGEGGGRGRMKNEKNFPVGDFLFPIYRFLFKL